MIHASQRVLARIRFAASLRPPSVRPFARLPPQFFGGRRAAHRTPRHPLRRLLKRTPTIGCGVDVVELARFRRAVKRGGTAFMRRIFTKQEEAYARTRRATTLLHLAGRFAAKEAVIKAVSQIDPKRALTMNQVEVRNDRLGRPHIVLHDGKAGRLHIHISLSHVDTVAVATAIALK